mmetsp:Transcript_27061/g.69638  ORF Transcript_27061/g.69638 Transcript_27061/m.69638 type:complete len:160 (+) Transcript_27061:3170-3649(+)
MRKVRGEDTVLGSVWVRLFLSPTPPPFACPALPSPSTCTLTTVAYVRRMKMEVRARRHLPLFHPSIFQLLPSPLAYLSPPLTQSHPATFLSSFFCLLFTRLFPSPPLPSFSSLLFFPHYLVTFHPLQTSYLTPHTYVHLYTCAKLLGCVSTGCPDATSL